MRRLFFIPILLTAAVGPYLAGDRQEARDAASRFAAFTNQIGAGNSSGGDALADAAAKAIGVDLASTPDAGRVSAWPREVGDAVDSAAARYGAAAGAASGTPGGSSGFGGGRRQIPVHPVSSGGASGGGANSDDAIGASATGSGPGVAAQLQNLAGSPAAAEAKEPTYDMLEVLRFDVTPRWVVNHWPRVTTVLAEMELEGLRVPLVTGTKATDLAGSLTYYFDKQHVVQRLTFQGFTGDDRRLVQFATQSYGLKRIPTLGAGLYMLQWNGDPRSALRIVHLPVVRSNAPNMRLEVTMEINRPRSYYGMSPEFKAQLLSDRENARW